MTVGKLIVETGVNNKGAQKGLISLVDLVKQTEAKIGRQLTQEEKKQVEDLYNAFYEKSIKINSLLDEIFKNGGKGIKSAIKNVTRWGLAILGVRSAYMLVHNAMTTITSQDEQLKADVDYMKNALAYMLEPLVRKIVEWAKQLMFYVGYIIKLWTGKNIFENANKSLKQANKSAKELQKTLTGFDEMNVLNSNGSVGALGATPSFDLSGLDDTFVPDWIYWIAHNKDIILTFVQALIVGLTGLKYGLEGIMFLGIGVAIISVVELIKDLITLINEPSWENFKIVLLDLTNAIIGVGIAMVAFNATNPVGWIVLAVGVIGNFITKLLDEKTATEKLTEAKDKLNRAERNFVNAQSTYVDAIKRRDDALKKLKESEEKTKTSGEELYKSVLLGKQSYEDLREAGLEETYLAYLNYKGAMSDVEDATKKLTEKEKDLITETIDVQAKTAVINGNFEELGNTLNELVKSGKLDIKDIKKMLENTYKDLDREGKKTFKEQLPKYIDQSTSETKELYKQLQKVTSQFDILNAKSRGHSFSVSPKAKGGIAYAKGGIVPTIKLASGAIINKPGSGIPIGGERAPEGVIPLTDSQQMALLGETIGKYVTINATIPVMAYNREVDRQIKRIKAEDNFASNR
ncbi:MAG: hypothetical protein IKV94_02625 [Clostridia bacterium]|nr:hypothetical protein [Clostridia bacterium]MBR6517089.1 hypothetical protein [Bacilli bacterium]